MGKVNLLPPEVAGKIAAGEVVERPASVVKELVENSLDAGAKTLEVKVKKSGKTFIQVKDSGDGIEPDDLEKIFLRHATSKISRAEDLYTVKSLGFRGEALYSIAAVSDVTLRSRTKGSDTGLEMHLRGGERISLRTVSMPVGTEIEVQEIFFNTPARRKFLKADATEFKQILNIFIPYTIIYPEYQFILWHESKNVLELLPEENRINRVSRVLNLPRESLLETGKEFPDRQVSLHLILGDINIQRPRRDLQFVFVNRRPVQHDNVSFVINKMYRSILPPESYPFFILDITVPPEAVDVNIHPAKREVKIKDENLLASRLHFLCQEVLVSMGQAKQVREVIFPDVKTSPSGSVSYPVPGSEIPLTQASLPGQEDFPKGEGIREDSGAGSLKSKLINSRYLGVFRNKYLFFETDNSLLIIDQHSAHERITYEKLKLEIETGTVRVQHLLVPSVINLSPAEMVSWEEGKERLGDIGFASTLWDKEHIGVHSHPQVITSVEPAIRNLLSGENLANCSNDSLVRRACRQSVMAGDASNKEEAEYLRNELVNCRDPFTCPHGRPTVIEITEKTFNKQFLRE
ncbi:MAG: DNA mismatch repair endonuclease MutL [Candidatus Omnitrophota bacterium]